MRLNDVVGQNRRRGVGYEIEEQESLRSARIYIIVKHQIVGHVYVAD